LTICSLFYALIIGHAAVGAQKKANFTGAWELDKAKSILPQREIDGLESLTWTVTQDDERLTREHKIEGDPGRRRIPGIGMRGPVTVKLDGSETTIESKHGKTTSKAEWLNHGKTLKVVIVGHLNGPSGGFTFTTTEHWELVDGGKTLKIHRKTESHRGKDESTWALTMK
jgi:hypothetical protein